MLNRPLQIYLCDLTHDTAVLVSDTIPINIGFVGAYAKKVYGEEIQLSLFKYPQTVIEAIQASPPDLIALSNYSWNSKLSERIARLVKTIHPETITAQGGTNFPHRLPQQLEFLLSRPHTDVYVELEGEVSFAELVGRVLAARDGGPGLFEEPVPGCVYLVPSTRGSHTPALVKGELPPRLRNLDDIPSPYLNGMLERFFDGRLTPFLETNRGCPFTCTFCHTGADYFNKINMFSMERITDEIAYIGSRASSLGIVNLHIADTNFGMYPRDRTICEALLESQRRYGWPRQIMSTTGKNNKERVIAITNILGNVFSVNMSVQSMDSTVLANIKRDNIRLEDYVTINQHLRKQGRSTKGELIIGMPGETKESFTRGVERVISAGVSSVCSYTLMLLHGTEFKDPAYRRQFQIQGKYRIVPLDFGEYAGERVFDTEEVGVATNTMSFDDYLWIRGLSLIVEIMHNNRPFDELIRYGVDLGVTRFQLIKRAYDGIDQAPEAVRSVVRCFMEETREELWDSDEELEAFYRRDENYSRLLRGEAGGNLIYTYKAVSLASCSQEWAAYLGTMLKELVKEQRGEAGLCQQAGSEIDLLVRYVTSKLAGVLNVDGDVGPRSLESPYDILGWLNSPEGTRLRDCRLPNPMTYTFEYTEDQLAARKDYFRRYGTQANALSKIVTRVSNVESLFRRLRVEQARQTVSPQAEERERDLLIRYTLSN